MKVFKGLACTAALAACILSVPAQAGTVAGFGGSTEITQLANNLEMVNQSIMQMRMVEMQLKNLVRLDGIPQWNQSAPLLQQVISTINGAQSIAWQGQMADQQFRRLYDTGRLLLPAGSNLPQAYGQRYQQWSEQTRNSTSAALQSAGLQAQNFQSESQALGYLRTLNDNPQGQMRAIQAGSSISAMVVEQLQGLRALQVSQIQMQAAALQEQSGQLSEKGNRKADLGDFWR